MKKISVAAIVLGAFCLSAQAVIITANDYVYSGWGDSFGEMGGEYTEQGFTFSPHSGTWNSGVRGGIGDVDGTTHLYATDLDGITFQQSEGKVFSLDSFDMSNASASAGNAVQVYMDYGLGTQSLLGTVDFAAGEVKTGISISGATAVNNIVFVSTQNNGVAIGFDNIDVTAVPEPGALALLPLGVAVLALLRRSHKG